MQTKCAVLHDAFSFIQTLSFRKIWNSIELYFSFHLSNLIKKPIVWGKPITVSIEPTTRCNLNCPECPTGNHTLNRPKGDIPINQYEQVIDEVRPYTNWLQLHFQGEPLLHPQISRMVRYANKSRIYTCMSTNGHFLSADLSEKLIRSGLNRLIISLDGADKDTYEKYRINGSFNKVTQGIQNMSEAKNHTGQKHPFIILQFIIFRHNEHQIKDIRKLGKETGADKVQIKTAQIYDYQNKKNKFPEQKKFSRYLKKHGNKAILKNEPKRRCKRLWLTTVLTFSGDILPCCFDKSGQHSMGNINNNSVYDTWSSLTYQNFRKHVLERRSSIPMCLNCTE